jgi:hypothetical protein
MYGGLQSWRGRAMGKIGHLLQQNNVRLSSEHVLPLLTNRMHAVARSKLKRRCA